MVHKPTTTLRITSGALAGSRFVTAKNGDGSVSFSNEKGEPSKVTVPSVTKGTFAVGSGGLPSADEPVIITSTPE